MTSNIVRAQRRGLFYSRDSGGKHETTPAQYVGWACREAEKLGVSLQAGPSDIDEMIRTGKSHFNDLFLDYGVQGHRLEREGLNALFAEIEADERISHVFIPHRDRLARPDDATDGMRLELRFRLAGITLVFMDRVCDAIGKGQSPDIGELIISLIDYHNAGKDRRDLAEKMIYAQIALAQNGFSVGGRARYGFDRWLVTAAGTPVRLLAEKERVRMPNHHTAWLPATDGRLEIALRIREMLRTTPASRVAAQLTREGIPSPDAGRTRKDNGVVHPVSGAWNQATIVSIGRNPLFAGLTTAGRRSMGDQLRFTPKGPRRLNEADFRTDDKPKVIQNPADAHIVANAHFQPLVDPEAHRELTEILDARAGTQRGKPRSRDPGRNPLGGRIFDVACRWLMYRAPCKQSYQYYCGQYRQSHGALCSHNHVDGPTAVRFVLSCLRQRIAGFETELEARLRKLAQRDQAKVNGDARATAAKNAIAQIGAELKTVKRNLPLARNSEQYEIIAAKFDELSNQKRMLDAQLKREINVAGPNAIEEEISSALALADRLAALANDEANLPAITELFGAMNVRLFLRFRPEQVKRRKLNLLVSGVLTMGTAPPPIDIYSGPTARAKLKKLVSQDSGKTDSDLPDNNNGSGSEGDSLRNVNRGDRI
jgi:hypothetical protein